MSSTYASIDLGATKIACGFVTADGHILREKTVPTQSHEGSAAVLERIVDLIDEMSDEADIRPLALSIGVPGMVDSQAGITRFLPNLPTQWRDVPVSQVLQSKLGCPVHLLGDVRMAALGEFVFGRGSAAHTMALFALGTGIGGGIVIDGKLRLGSLGSAGELGHQTIIADGPLCGCGNRGCLETLASGPAITGHGVWAMLCGRAPKLHEIVSGNPALVSPKEMVIAAQAGDETVRDILVRAAEYVGIGVANVITILHPDLVVLGGSVAEIGPLLFDTVRQTVKRRVGMFPVDGVRIEKSALGTNAGLLGGVVLATRPEMIVH